MSTQYTDHFFYLAPIRGITDALFRRVYHTHFPYFDAAVAPFLNPQRFASFSDRLFADILPENNTALSVIPQLLYNTADDFINTGKHLQNLGYNHINWNLGCPAPMVANKRRGSGLLPYSDRIVALLETVHEHLNAEISLKMRLGFKDPADIEVLLPQLQHFPLQEIIIHPRIGKQLYRGKADHDGFAKCLPLTDHQVVYNGDICTKGDFVTVSRRFPQICRWMIGRGALADPFLLADIRNIPVTPQQRKEKLISFHHTLYEELRRRLDGPGHLLNRMKQIWTYLIGSFPENQRLLKKIRKASTEERYHTAITELFAD
ncbi:MAG: tRNA-dihydrouridine synthase family protein [Desulfopila sp.]|nr:tRNA-dihydrouridine synthase family protein [Desulfopila sp.]